MVDSETRPTDSPSVVTSALRRYGHLLALEVIMVFMFWIRVQPREKLLSDGTVSLFGADSWYHLRQVIYTTQNWPHTMQMDPYTGFAEGAAVGQFGTLFDQILATVALMVGLGDPSLQTIKLVVFFAPAIFGVLMVIPTYLIGERFAGRSGGVLAALFLAFIPGEFLTRSLVGFADHNIAEPFFQTFAVFFLIVAITAAERDKPVYEQLRYWELDGIRSTIGWSVASGLALAAYILVWPSGVLLLAIFAAYYTIRLVADYVRGVSPDHIAITGVVSQTVAAVVLLVTANQFSLVTSPTSYSLLQPILAFATAAGAAYLAVFARVWDKFDLPEYGYAGAVAGKLVGGVVMAKLVAPQLTAFVWKNVSRVLLLGQGGQMMTISEAQPFLSLASPQRGIIWFDVILQEYGMLFFFGLAGFGLMLFRLLRNRDAMFNGRILMLVWATVLGMAAFTQVRFNYYLSIPVALFAALAVMFTIRSVGITRKTSIPETVRGLETHQWIVVGLLVVLLVPGLAIPVSIGGTATGEIQTTTVFQSERMMSDHAIEAWSDPGHWMKKNTPAVGQYGGADNNLPPYGTYERTSNFDYPAGSYGVMSWWDYGHWITTMADRPAVANPFQQNVWPAANFLLAPNQQEAENALDKVNEDDAKVQFVMVDWQMVSAQGKLGAITQFTRDEKETLYNPVAVKVKGPNQRFQGVFPQYTDRYYSSLMVKLYRYHGSAVKPLPVVVDYTESKQGYRVIGGTNSSTGVKKFKSLEKAREYANNHESAQLGGVGGIPTKKVDALKHYRLVKYSDVSALTNPTYKTMTSRTSALAQLPPSAFTATYPSAVKTFEKVPGATIRGDAPKNTTLRATVELHIPTVNKTFTYTQYTKTGSDGTYSFTVPYATTGYNKTTVKEGYTDTNIRATGPYTITSVNNSTYTATVSVEESKVVGADDSPVRVTESDTKNESES